MQTTVDTNKQLLYTYHINNNKASIRIMDNELYNKDQVQQLINEFKISDIYLKFDKFEDRMDQKFFNLETKMDNKFLHLYGILTGTIILPVALHLLKLI